MVVSELRGEKIDIIPYNEEPARFVAKALSPARVREVLVDDETKEATVIVPDDQLSLAIGREGQNARLAAKLTGWKVDIKSETDFSHEDVGDIEEGEVDDGRCAAVLSAGRRCPNASLDGSRFCGLPQHQALARFGTNQVTVLVGLSDEDVATLADPDADEGRVAELVKQAEDSFEEPGEDEAAAEEASEEPEAEEAPAEEPEAEEPADEPEAEEAAEEPEETPEDTPDGAGDEVADPPAEPAATPEAEPAATSAPEPDDPAAEGEESSDVSAEEPSEV
jgi:N utilization substance protein A